MHGGSNTGRVLLALAVLAVVVLAAMTVLGVSVKIPQGQQTFQILQTSKNSGTPQTSQSPQGVIFVSSTDNPSASLLDTYAVAVDGSRRVVLGGTADSVGNFYTFSQDGKTAAFIGATRNRLQQFSSGVLPEGGVMQVYRGQLSPQGLPTPDNAEQLTASNGSSKEMPAISGDGSLIAYVVASSSAHSVDDSTIHLISAQGDQAISPGIMPQWLFNATFYYIAPDGIRLYDVGASTSTLVLSVPGQANFKISVSPDRGTLAFSNPDADSVFFFAIGSNGRTLTPVKTLSIRGFWTVFSPDSKYVAVQVAQGQGDAGGGPALDIFDADSFSQVSSVSLGSLLNDRLFVTAWVE